MNHPGGSEVGIGYFIPNFQAQGSPAHDSGYGPGDHAWSVFIGPYASSMMGPTDQRISKACSLVPSAPGFTNQVGRRGLPDFRRADVEVNGRVGTKSLGS